VITDWTWGEKSSRLISASAGRLARFMASSATSGGTASFAFARSTLLTSIRV
jgi:hypothetical protein